MSPPNRPPPGPATPSGPRETRENGTRDDLADLREGVGELPDSVYDMRDSVDRTGHRDKIEKQLANLPGLADAVGNIKTIKDLRQINVETLIKLEDKYEGILLYAFSDIVGESQKIDFANWETYKKPAPGMRLQIDFRGNAEAEMKLGAADMLPPSVRRITVYENGNPQLVRTSVRRVGLKGQNQPDRGFYDQKGYIPVYSGDVIEIEAVQEKFDEPFRTKTSSSPQGVLDQDAFAKYEQSEEGKQDKEFLGGIFTLDNPTAQRGKQIRDTELQALVDGVEASGVGERVAKIALELAGKHVPHTCCWDWIKKIYDYAGARPRRIYQDLNYSGKDCGDHHAGTELMSKIRPGDWLYINNKNNFDRYGCHSVVLLEWIEPGKIARCASSPRSTSPGRIHEVNFTKSPVTHISKPAPV